MRELKTYSWAKAAYDGLGGSVQSSLSEELRWGTGYATFATGNPSSDTAVGLLDDQIGQLPSAGLTVGGADCVLGSDEPEWTNATSPSEPAYLQYIAIRTELLNSGTLTSADCRRLFNADPNSVDYDAVRAADFAQLTARVRDQRPFSGPKTTKSRFEAGLMSISQQGNANAVSILKTTPVCRAYIRNYNFSLTEFASATAQAQGVGRPGADPPAKIFLTTDPLILPSLTPGTVLHEALHSITGKSDDELLLYVGQPAPGSGNSITRKLLQANCAPR